MYKKTNNDFINRNLYSKEIKLKKLNLETIFN